MLTTPTIASETNGKPHTRIEERPDQWPRDILAAYARDHGPYTVDNANTILEEEAVELYNGWLVWQEMTNPIERRVVANLQTMLDLSARKVGFGQAMPDQLECLLTNGDVVKPDASLLSWRRLENDLVPTGPNQRPLLSGGPELAIEVRSPSNWRAQERRKRQLYFANGVQIVWDVDEANQVIWVYHAARPDRPTRHGIGDEITCEPFLPGWRRAIADIFAEQASAEAVAGEVAVAWRAEGVEIGRAEGVEIGIAQRNQEIARTMIQEGVDPALITRVTGLTPAEIAKLIEQSA
ncbi:MAG: Uma2 family endonuclease [Caldilineaceae bacterium]